MLIVLGVALLAAAVAWYRWLPGWERRSFPRFAEALDQPWYYWVHIVGGASLLLAVGLLVLVDGLAPRLADEVTISDGCEGRS